MHLHTTHTKPPQRATLLALPLYQGVSTPSLA